MVTIIVVIRRVIMNEVRVNQGG